MATPWLTNLTLPNVTLAPSLTISKSNQIKGLLELDKSNIITRKADSFVPTLHIHLAVESKQKRGKKTKGEVFFFFSFSTHLDVSLCLQLPTISSQGLCWVKWSPPADNKSPQVDKALELCLSLTCLTAFPSLGLTKSCPKFLELRPLYLIPAYCLYIFLFCPQPQT